MKIAAYTPCSGLLDQACMSSTTWSVIRLTVSLATEAPYTSAKWALISPVVNPFAYNDSTTRSTSLSRRCRLPTITGAKVPSRSRGTSISTCPAASVSTVLARVPLRELPWLRPPTACLS